MTQETQTDTPATGQPKLSPRAVELLRKVQEAITNDRHTYNQDFPARPFFQEPDCDSPACIIGWMEFFNKGPVAPDIMTEDQRGRLYYASEWPQRFYAGGTAWKHIRAETAVERIDHFIATDGEE